MAAHETTAPARTPKTPFLGASALFCAIAVLIGVVAIRPLGAAELLGLLACVAAASAAATIPFVIDFTRRLDAPRAPAIDANRLAAQVADLVEARLAATEDRRRDEILRAAQAARPESATAAAALPTSDQISAPAAAKPRLGRGLSSLIHNPAALAKPASATPSGGEDERAAA